MTRSIENRFIPLFVFPSAVLAILSPYLPILIRDLGYSPVWVGILMGITNVAGIAGPILFGYLADKTGNYRPVLIISCLLPALIVIPLIRWVNPVFSAILLSLMAFGLRSTTALVDAITTIQIGRTGNYGRIRVWGSISFILLTLYLQWTPFLKLTSAQNIAVWAIIASLVSLTPILLFPGVFLQCTKEHPPTQHRETPPAPERKKERWLPAISGYVLGGFIVIFLCSFSMSAVYAYFPLYLTESLQWNAVGLMFAVAAAAEVPCMFLSAALIRRFGSFPLLAVSALGITLRFLIWAFLPYKSWIVVSQMLHSLCFGIFHPAAVHFTASIFPAHRRGTGMSVYMTLGTGLPSFVGNMVGGALVQAAGYQFLFIIYAAVAAVAVLMCGAIRLSGSVKERGGGN